MQIINLPGPLFGGWNQPAGTPRMPRTQIFDPIHRVMETPRTMQKRGTTAAKFISQTRETDGSNGDKVMNETFLSRVYLPH
jgi:hypothetical protein